MIKNMKTRERFGNGVIYAILSFLSFIWLIPIAWLILVSFRAEPGAYTEYIFPKSYTLDNYIKLFTDTKLFNYPRWFINTLIVAIVTCIVSTIIVLLTSYALSRLRFKLRKPIMNVALVLGMFPGFMSMIAVYYVLKAINLTQSLVALVLVYSAGAGINYYICKGFFDTVPRALDEAARIDGATNAQIFWKIIMPLSGPIVVYTALMSFMAPWTDFIAARIIMGDNYQKYTVAIGMYQMIEKNNINDNFRQFNAGCVCIGVPIIIMFIIMQRFYVGGVTSGAVKS